MRKKIILTGILTLFISSAYIYGQKNVSTIVSQNFQNGEIISSQNGTLKSKLSLSSTSYDNSIIGVFFKYEKEDLPSSPDGAPVLIPDNNIVKTEGITMIKFNMENGTIHKGDPITSSSTPGIAMKATESGIILGIALEDANKSNGLVKCRILIQYLK